ncbi:hypothetical protein BGX29_005897 [Mortierella sp. GBA35]|nr:hypothetical protein BGX29_005897 [Mortierella sp. GBA35]
MSNTLAPAPTSTHTSTHGPVPVPASLDELVKLLHAELGSNGLDSEGVDVDRVKALMTNYISNEDDWAKYAHFDKGRYTRNLVDDGNGKFNLMILAWLENVGSAIHDHSGSHCLMKVLDGKLQETLYEWPDRVHLESDHPVDSAGSPPCVGSAEDWQGFVVVAPVYTPYETCKTFNEKSSMARSSGKCVFFSAKGQKLQSCPSTAYLACSLTENG